MSSQTCLLFRKQDFPLNDALQELLQQGVARARQLGDAQRELDTLQVRAHTSHIRHRPHKIMVNFP